MKSSAFSCVFFDAESSVEWFRPKISMRNVAAVFPDRPRYVLIDTSAQNVMVLPSGQFFCDLESGHHYMVPECRAGGSPRAKPEARTMEELERAAAAAAAANTPPQTRSESNRDMGVSNTPVSHSKGTLKGFKFKDAKEKMMRKKKGGHLDDGSAQETKLRHRKSQSNLRASEPESRRRSSTAGKALEKLSWGKEESAAALGDDSGSIVNDEKNIKVSEVTVLVTKDTMAMGPLSPDVLKDDTLKVQRLDPDGNVEVMIRNQPHLVRLDCIQLLPLESSASADQKSLHSEIIQRIKEKRRMSGGGSFRRAGPNSAQRSVLSQIRSKMHKQDETSPQSMSPSLSSSNPGDFPDLALEVPQDEKLNPSSVYGKPLAMNERPIPGPVKKCIEFFRRHDHIKYEGIFRVPGSSNAVMRIRNQFLVSSSSKGYEIPDDENPTVVASALKTFLFELPEPLVPMEQWYPLMEITDARDLELKDALALLDELPEDNVEVLRYLFDFLAEVSEYSDENKMTPANLGMVFGIVLLRPPDQNVSNVGSSMPKEVCTFLIENVDDVFPFDDESGSD